MKFHIVCAACGKRLNPEPLDLVDALRRVTFGRAARQPWIVIADSRGAPKAHGKGVAAAIKQWLFGTGKPEQPVCEVTFRQLMRIVERN